MIHTVEQIVLVPVDKLIKHERNTRIHPKHQIVKLKKSIKRFGFNVPILINAENIIIAGHARLQAAQELGMESVPCIDVKHLKEGKEQRGFLISDNRITQDGEWDWDELTKEIIALEENDKELLDALGFNDIEIKTLLDGGYEDGDEEAEEREWGERGMPDFSNKDKTGFKTLMVHFATEKDLKDFAEYAGQKITTKTKYIWLPQQPTESHTENVFK